MYIELSHRVITNFGFDHFSYKIYCTIILYFSYSKKERPFHAFTLLIIVVHRKPLRFSGITRIYLLINRDKRIFLIS